MVVKTVLTLVVASVLLIAAALDPQGVERLLKQSGLCLSNPEAASSIPQRD